MTPYLVLNGTWLSSLSSVSAYTDSFSYNSLFLVSDGLYYIVGIDKTSNETYFYQINFYSGFVLGIENNILYIIEGNELETLNLTNPIEGILSVRDVSIITNMQIFFQCAYYINNTIYVIVSDITNNLLINQVFVISMLENNVNSIIGEVADYVYPYQRTLHSMKPINNLIYMFGGYSNGVYFQDLWTFDPELIQWEALALIGSLPSPRHSHACDSNGDTFIIFGGTDSNQFLNDMFIFNSITRMWTEIFPVNNVLPSPRKGACLVFIMPLVYIYGGESYNGPTNELWIYNFNYNQFKMMQPGPIASTYHYCQLSGEIFYVATTYASNFVGCKYNVSSGEWSDFPQVYLMTSASVILDGVLFSFGGYDQYQGIDPGYLRIGASPNFFTNVVGIDVGVFYNSGASFYYKSFLYFHNGGATSFGDPYANQEIATPVFGSLDLYYYAKLNNTGFECSPGTYLNGSVCELCSPGSYAEGFGNVNCTLCQIGTFNTENGATSKRQCYPCPEGTLSLEGGSKYCFQCPINFYCPVGAKSYYPSKVTSGTMSFQPENYSQMHNSHQVEETQLYSGIGICVSVLIIAAIFKYFKYLQVIDTFAHQHNYTMGKFMKIKKTNIGAIFTLIFIGIALFIVVNVIASYYLDNIIEIKALQPLPVLQSTVAAFEAQIQVTTSFIYYGDSCGNLDSTCGNEITIQIQGLTYDSSSQTCVLDEAESACIVTFVCTNCVLQSSGNIEVRLMETYSFASGIKVNVSSSSSIPESFSTVVSTIVSDSNQVFIGSTGSIFAFLLTPSLFISDSSQFPSGTTGYHVTLESFPSYGSQSTVQNLPILTNLVTQIQFIQSQSGLLTNRYIDSTILVLVSNLLGSIGGVMSIVGFFMGAVEEKYNKVEKKIKQKKKFEYILQSSQNMRSAFEQKGSKILEEPEQTNNLMLSDF